MRTLAKVGIGAATVAGVGISAARGFRAWRDQPHPYGDRLPEFAAEGRIVVPTDDNAQLSVAFAGKGEQVALLIHGITASGDDWAYVADLLVEHGFRVYAMDQRGHGRSTVGTDGFSWQRLGKDVQTVVRSLDLTDFALVGHSMGGMAALSWAAQDKAKFEERVEHLFLVATLGRITAPAEILGRLAFRARWSAAAKFWPAARVVARFAVFGKDPSTAMIDQVIQSALETDRSIRVAAAEGLEGYNVLDDVADLDVHTTVICGSRDLVTPLAENKRLARTIPDARLIVVYGAGHQVIWERAEALAEEIVGAMAVELTANRSEDQKS